MNIKIDTDIRYIPRAMQSAHSYLSFMQYFQKRLSTACVYWGYFNFENMKRLYVYRFYK